MFIKLTYYNIIHLFLHKLQTNNIYCLLKITYHRFSQNTNCSRKSRLRHCSLPRPVNCSHTHSRCLPTCYSLADLPSTIHGVLRNFPNATTTIAMAQQLFTTRAHSLSVSLSLFLQLFRSPALRQQQVSVATTNNNNHNKNSAVGANKSKQVPNEAFVWLDDAWTCRR